MATKSEKTVGTIFGTVLGVITGYQYIKNNGIPEEERWKYILGGGAGGAIGGFGCACLFGSPNDTVNYKLFNGKKRVYHGIAFKDRVMARKAEHINDGKLFTKVVVDNNQNQELKL